MWKVDKRSGVLDWLLRMWYFPISLFDCRTRMSGILDGILKTRCSSIWLCDGPIRRTVCCAWWGFYKHDVSQGYVIVVLQGLGILSQSHRVIFHVWWMLLQWQMASWLMNNGLSSILGSLEFVKCDQLGRVHACSPHELSYLRHLSSEKSRLAPVSSINRGYKRCEVIQFDKLFTAEFTLTSCLIIPSKPPSFFWSSLLPCSLVQKNVEKGSNVRLDCYHN